MNESDLLHTIGLNGVPCVRQSMASLLSGGTCNFLKERSRWEALCADSSLIPNAIEEVLRRVGLDVGYHGRAAPDLTLGKREIEESDRVRCANYSATYDDNVFEDAVGSGRYRKITKMSRGFGWRPINRWNTSRGLPCAG